jgi:hypothetical protein
MASSVGAGPDPATSDLGSTRSGLGETDRVLLELFEIESELTRRRPVAPDPPAPLVVAPDPTWAPPSRTPVRSPIADRTASSPVLDPYLDAARRRAEELARDWREAGSRLEPLSAAVEAIAGYAVVNDVTARDFQNRTPQWLQGKTFEGTCPLGPVLVTPDEVDHARDLEITCEVDGEVVQRARTSDLLFSPAALVSYVSRLLTLRPGDVVCTGTPGGVGAGMDPPRFLQDGCVVRTAIEGIGELVNVCVTETP